MTKDVLKKQLIRERTRSNSDMLNKLLEENKRLKSTLESGEATYIETLKNSLEY